MTSILSRPAGLLAACALCLPALAAGDARVIVKFKADSVLLRAQAQAATAATAPATGRAEALGRRMGLPMRGGAAIAPRTQVVLAAGIDAAQLAARLARESDVEYAVVDRRRFAAAMPNDPRYLSGPPLDLAAQTGGPVAGQWYLRAPDSVRRSAINAEAAWDQSTGDTRVVVAVLDTGVRFDHPDLLPVALGGKLLAGRDFVSDVPIANDGNGWDADASDPGDWISADDRAANPDAFGPCAVSDSSWHGTQVAGIVAASTDNGIGMASVGRNVRVLPVRVLGKCGGFDSDIIAAMRWSAGLDVPGVPTNPNPAWVVNLSLGSEDACTGAYADAVAELDAVGTVVVASAGNAAGHPVGSPANCPGVVAVAGLRHAGSKVGFSNMGPEIALSAPAGNCVDTGIGDPCQYPILTLVNTGSTGPVSHAAGGSGYTDAFAATYGTSFAAPLVAGTAALMLSVQPFLSADEVRNGLRATTRPFPQSGAVGDPGDPPVAACPAPQPGVDLEQQCYCSTATCGSGMLDAAAAARAAHLQARIGVSIADPLPGQTVVLDADDTLLTAGRVVSDVAWQLVDGGGVVGALVPGAAGTASAIVSGRGSFTVRLIVTDSTGLQSRVLRTVRTQGGGGSGGSGGGGAFAFGWLAALAAATLLLSRWSRSAGSRGPARRR